MTRPRKIALWVLAVVVALLAILVIVIATFDWNRVKPTLNAKVSEALHRPFAINGNLDVVWQREPDEGGWRAYVPWPRFVADDIILGNPEWAKNPQMVGLQHIEFRLSPLPLLAQRVVIPRIDLTAPTANLERLKDGRASWLFDFGPSDPKATPSKWIMDIGAIKFDKGRVAYSDETLQAQLEVLIDPLGKPIAYSDIVGSSAAKKVSDQGATAQDYAFALAVKGR